MLVYTEFGLNFPDRQIKYENVENGFKFCFKSFGVNIGIESNNIDLLNKIVQNLSNIIPLIYIERCSESVEHKLFLKSENNCLTLFIDDEFLGSSESEENLLDYFAGRIRLKIAEFAVGKVFLHAGVVGWKGKALIFPGNSFSGKTTIVKELIKKGAVYFSDEYAILDEHGMNFPFPKNLSIRGIIDKYKQLEVDPKEFNAQIAEAAIPVGTIFLTEFEKEAEWNPVVLSQGTGVLEILPHTIPIRHNPKFSLEVLNKIANRVIIAKSKRGEAEKVVNLLFKFIENETKSN